MTDVRNVVLVHGGFVDGSGWQGVHDLLKADGFNVSVVQNQTLSLDSDVESTHNVLDQQDGPAILVGHSYEEFAVPAPGAPLFQAAAANLNPWTEAKVDTENAARGPLLLISGETDNTVPWAIVHASFEKQKRNPGVTEIVQIPDRGHALTIDGGWRQVATTTLEFIKRFA